MSLTAIPVTGVPEVRPDDDLSALIVAAATAPGGPGLADGDVLVVTSKVVSKAEGRLVRGRDREAVIDEETERVVAQWQGPNGRTVIAGTRHGLVLAAAGVDASNVEPGTLVLLPDDPDASARRARSGIRSRTGANVGVLVSDTMGRAWRVGQTDAAIGAAGIRVLDDLRGSVDTHGNRLDVTVRAVADEIAGLAELVAGKTSAVPAVVVRGLDDVVLGPDDHGPGAAALIRPQSQDRFGLGTSEAILDGMAERRTTRSFTADPVPRQAILRAVEAAVTAPAPHHTTPWRFLVVDTEQARHRLLDAMNEQWVADLRSDGLLEPAIERRTRRGDVLRRAPALVVPCLATDLTHVYPDARRLEAERSMFLLSMGAGIQNFLVALTAQRLGSAWISSTLFAPAVVRQALHLPEHWSPMGAIAVGCAGGQPGRRQPRDLAGIVLTR